MSKTNGIELRMQMTRVNPRVRATAGSENRMEPTARTSGNLQQIIGAFDTLTDGLDYAAGGETGFNFYSGRGALEQAISFAQLRDRALETGRRLIRAGLKRGDRVSVVAETTPEFMEVFFGCQYAGLIPCPMPYSTHIGGRDAFVKRLAGMMRAARTSCTIASSDLLASVQEAALMANAPLILSHDELAGLPSTGIDLAPFGKDDAAYIQYSSGSTSAPKGVLISQRAITTNARCILSSGLKVRSGDRGVSWLPLYHDMGLVGFCIAPMMGQFSIDYLATTAFARRPMLWLKLMSENQCNCSYSPSFGYDLAARRSNGSAGDLDLSAWRVAGIGGDMVRPDVLKRFSEAFDPAGFDPRAFLPSYGMAETTLAITFIDPDEEIEIDCVDRARYKLSNKAVSATQTGAEGSDRTRSFVVCGRVIPGHRIEVRDDTGSVLGEREIGHIFVAGPSLMSGYFEDRDATSRVIDDEGWLRTGDMGYMIGGQIVVTGRSKDLILHNGRNIWPQDIEWALESLSEIRDGDVAAFATDNDNGDDAVVVLIQCRLRDEAEREALRRAAAALVHQHAGVECEIVLVAPKSLPFTSSGKLSRAGAKRGYQSGEIGEITTGDDPRRHMAHSAAE